MTSVCLSYQKLNPVCSQKSVAPSWLMQTAGVLELLHAALRTDHHVSVICSFNLSMPIPFTRRLSFIFFLPSFYLVWVLLPASAARWKWGRLHGNMPSHPWLARGWSGILTARFDRATERKRNNNPSRLLNINPRRVFNTACVLLFVRSLIRACVLWGAMHRFEEVMKCEQLGVRCHTNALVHCVG